MKKIYILSILVVLLMSGHCAMASQSTAISQTIDNDVEHVTVCDSLVWHGTTYTESGTYLYDHTLTEPDRPGVDTLYLTVNHSSTGVDEQEVCDAIIWYDQLYDDTASHPTHTLSNAAGCDSVVTLNLTIHQSSET
ncbi:MAG: hypothetical protein IKH97_04845, partial [Bacteroidales bacterium]|nr:hypothetical protein [Bacteroidales bacterium]